MKALLVIDIQEKYLPFYDVDLLSRINARISSSKSAGIPVFYVRNIGIHGVDENYALAKDLLITSDHIYDKKFPSAFTNSSFAKDLENMNITDIEIIGVDGNSCVKKTCIDAAEAGFKVFLNLQCTGARNARIFEKTLNELSEQDITLLYSYNALT